MSPGLAKRVSPSSSQTDLSPNHQISNTNSPTTLMTNSATSSNSTSSSSTNNNNNHSQNKNSSATMSPNNFHNEISSNANIKIQNLLEKNMQRLNLMPSSHQNNRKLQITNNLSKEDIELFTHSVQNEEHQQNQQQQLNEFLMNQNNPYFYHHAYNFNYASDSLQSTPEHQHIHMQNVAAAAFNPNMYPPSMLPTPTQSLQSPAAHYLAAQHFINQAAAGLNSQTQQQLLLNRNRAGLIHPTTSGDLSSAYYLNSGIALPPNSSSHIQPYFIQNDLNNQMLLNQKGGNNISKQNHLLRNVAKTTGREMTPDSIDDENGSPTELNLNSVKASAKQTVIKKKSVQNYSNLSQQQTNPTTITNGNKIIVKKNSIGNNKTPATQTASTSLLDEQNLNKNGQYLNHQNSNKSRSSSSTSSVLSSPATNDNTQSQNMVSLQQMPLIVNTRHVAAAPALKPDIQKKRSTPSTNINKTAITQKQIQQQRKPLVDSKQQRIAVKELLKKPTAPSQQQIQSSQKVIQSNKKQLQQILTKAKSSKPESSKQTIRQRQQKHSQDLVQIVQQNEEQNEEQTEELEVNEEVVDDQLIDETNHEIIVDYEEENGENVPNYEQEYETEKNEEYLINQDDEEEVEDEEEDSQEVDYLEEDEIEADQNYDEYEEEEEEINDQDEKIIEENNCVKKSNSKPSLQKRVSTDFIYSNASSKTWNKNNNNKSNASSIQRKISNSSSTNSLGQRKFSNSNSTPPVNVNNPNLNRISATNTRSKMATPGTSHRVVQQTTSSFQNISKSNLMQMHHKSQSGTAADEDTDEETNKLLNSSLNAYSSSSTTKSMDDQQQQQKLLSNMKNHDELNENGDNKQDNNKES
jgi:hypothetical protein